MHDWLYAERHEKNIHSESCEKILKPCNVNNSHKGLYKRKETKDRHLKNSSCRFYGIKCTSGEGRAPFENLILPSGREESVGLILAECCSSNEVFPPMRGENCSERGCRSCGHKIRHGAKLYSFIEQAVCSTNCDIKSYITLYVILWWSPLFYD